MIKPCKTLIVSDNLSWCIFKINNHLYDLNGKTCNINFGNYPYNDNFTHVLETLVKQMKKILSQRSRLKKFCSRSKRKRRLINHLKKN